MSFHAEFTRPATPSSPTDASPSDTPTPPSRATRMPPTSPTREARDRFAALITSPDRTDRLAAALDPLACPELLRRLFDSVVDDAHPIAQLLRAVVAARLHVAWRTAHAAVDYERIARAAAGRVPLEISVAFLQRALRWSGAVRSTLGRSLRANPDRLAALLGDRWWRE